MHTAEAPWHFVTLPAGVADEIEDLPAATRRGFGSLRVEATIGNTSWNTSIFPDSRTTSYLLPVKKAVREAEGLREGDLVDVALEVQQPPP